MIGKRAQLFLSGVFLTLVLMKPNVPIVAGVALLALVTFGARFDLSSKAPKKRWAAFKRLFVLSTTGLLLVLFGRGLEAAPWNMPVGSAAEARHAFCALALYAIALIGAPSLAWIHLSLREPRTRRRAARRDISTTLQAMAITESKNAKLAV